jgi:hypothetical protein
MLVSTTHFLIQHPIVDGTEMNRGTWQLSHECVNISIHIEILDRRHQDNIMDTHTTTPEPVAMEPAKASLDWAGIVLFIVLAFGISWVIWLGLAAVGVSFTIRVSIGMFGPAVAATLVRLIRKDGFADAGLRLAARGRKGVIHIYIAAYVIPPVLIAAGIGLALLTGINLSYLTDSPCIHAWDPF